jgi:molybdopterin-guanine dinucleotide biosynthesis protein A/rhodanese-related sulfurtransferase
VSFSGAVLVGGRSTRMGVDKALLFAGIVEDALRAAGAAEVLRIADDDVPGVGPLGGIATALRQASHDIVVILACDLPKVRAEGIRAVVQALEASPDAAVALPPGEPLHAAWRRSARAEVLDVINGSDLSVRAALRRLVTVEVAGIPAEWLTNVNTPSDLHQTGVMADDIPEIDVEELARRHAAGAFVLDVRNPDEYEEAHVPGAVLIPLGELGERWEEVPEGEVLVICKSGARSGRAVQALNQAGRTTTNVAGGTMAWIDAGHPVVTGTDPR